MPFALMNAVAEESDRQRRAAQGDPTGTWNPDLIPDPPDPDGAPPRELFVAYAMGLGADRKWAEAEFDRQCKGGGYGPLGW